MGALLLSVTLVSVSFYAYADLGNKYHQIFYRGLHLKSAGFHFPPFMIESKENNHSSTNATYSGYGAEILTSLKEHFEIFIDYVPVNQSDVQKFGLTQAVVNQLVVRKEVDIVPMILFRTPQRMQVMEFTLPVMIGDNRLMVPYPKEESRSTAIAEPYQPSVWISIIASTFLIAGCMTFFAYFHVLWFKENQYGNNLYRIMKHQTDYTLTVLLDQGNYLPYSSWPSMRFVASCWCLMAVVLVNAYQGSLTSVLAIPKLSPVPQSVEELAESGKKYKMTAEINTATTDTFYAAKYGPYKVIGDNLRRYPYLLFRNFDQATEIMLTYGAAYLRGGLEIVNRIAADVKANNGTCRFTASRYLGDVTFLSFGLSKGSSYNTAINKMLVNFRDSGLLDRWFNMYQPRIDKCLIKRSQDSQLSGTLKSYTIRDLSGAFILFALGITFCLLVFLCELIIFNSLKTIPMNCVSKSKTTVR